MSADATLAAIDAAVGCQQCGKPLGGSVSDDFDSEECQTAWHAARASRLDGEVAQVVIRLDIEPDALDAGLVAMRAALTNLAVMRDESIARAYEQLVARQREMRVPND